MQTESTDPRPAPIRGRYKTSGVDMSAPMPLGFHRGVQLAVELRRESNSYTYTVISLIMRRYHGIDRSNSWWREQCKAAGIEPRPRGHRCYGYEHLKDAA